MTDERLAARKIKVSGEVYARLGRLAARSRRTVPNVVDVLSANEDAALRLLIGRALPVDGDEPGSSQCEASAAGE